MKKSSNNKIIIWAFLFTIQVVHAKTTLQSSIFGSNLTLTHKGNAFWHRSNQLGAFDRGGYISISRNGRIYNLFNYGFSVFGNSNNFNTLGIPIGHVSKNIKGLNFKIRRWEKSITAESDLSTGSLIRGNNVIPIPQISLSVPFEGWKRFSMVGKYVRRLDFMFGGRTSWRSMDVDIDRYTHT